MDRHLSSITALAIHMLKDPFIAEDVAQTVFLKTWKMTPNWEPGQATLLTWMRRVATNQCLDILRKKSPIYTDQVPDVADTSHQPLQAMSEKEQQDLIKIALSQLPDRQKAALTLAYYQNVSQKEGANILGVSISAYESLLARARKGLRKIINNDIMFESLLGAAS